MIVEATVETIAPPVSLEDRRDTLHERLNRGFQTIERAAQEGRNVDSWERAWLKLLKEYEEVCDQIAARH